MKTHWMLGRVYGEWQRPAVAAAIIAFLGLILLTEKPQQKPTKPVIERTTENRSVWIEYNGFWGNPAVDGQWIHWNYKPHKYVPGQDPPSKIPVPVFPQLGLYSSHDISVIQRHFRDLVSVGVDAVLLQWYPPGRVDERDEPELANFTDATLALMLEVADQFHIKVGVQIQNYEHRNNETVFADIDYFMRSYSSRPEILRVDGAPVVVIYDPHTIRGLFYAIENLTETWGRIYFIGNVLERQQIANSLDDGFSASFSYFASEGLSFCSNVTQWRGLVKYARERGLKFFPTVGPGFDASLVNPWASKEKRSRESGEYYSRMWKEAVNAKPATVIINSFNSFREGTNIENAVNRKGFDFSDATWTGAGGDPSDFMSLTREWISFFKGFATQPPV